MLQIRRSNIVRFAITLAILVVSFSFAEAAVTLGKGKELQITFNWDVSSKDVKPGKAIPITLVDSIEIGGIVVVKAKTPGWAEVTKVEPAGKGGKPGSISVTLKELEPGSGYKPVGDLKIQIEFVDGKPLQAQGKSKKLLSYIFGFGLFIKGSEGVIRSEVPYKAIVKENIRLNTLGTE